MGFPSPAADYVEKRIDLNAILMPHRNKMLLIETPDGFVLADKSLKPVNGDTVVFQLASSLNWGNCSTQALSLRMERSSTANCWKARLCSAW